MKRTTRKEQAIETVAICEQGYYLTANGHRVDFAHRIDDAKKGTRLYSLENTPVDDGTPQQTSTRISVANDTAFSAIRQLATHGAHVACLNFASAKNAGGGFLGGAEAQEEALARASALYSCLLMAPAYYERNRANPSKIYLDLAIWSPLVPFFRDDTGALLDEPLLASVITAPAPNAGAVALNEPEDFPLVEPALVRRAEQVLAIARAHRVERLILGAWGCGVFRNDPQIVASIFARLLFTGGKYHNVFHEILFAVFDRTAGQATYRAFDAVFGGGAK